MQVTKEKKIIVVVGPGRSGTSAITRGLKVLGVDLGSNLMPARVGVNDKGFWEDQDIYELNNDVFNALGFVWHRLLPVDTISSNALTTLTHRAVELLQRKIESSIVYGMKDPQITRLLPFWRDVFARVSTLDYYVIACRNPISVARSLSKYTDFEIEKCYQLWFDYTLESLTKTVSNRRVVVSYDELMSNAASQIKRIAHCINLPFEESGELLSEYTSDFLDSDLQHHHLSLEDVWLNEAVPPKVRRLYELMLRFSDDTLAIDSQEAAQEIDVFVQLHQEELSLLTLSQASEDALAAKVKELGERDAVISSLGETISSVVTERDAYKEATHGLEEQLRIERNTYKDAMRDLEAQVRLEKACWEKVRDEHASVIDDQTRMLEEYRAQISHFADRSEALAAELARLYSSRSWRLTRPLRRINLMMNKANGRECGDPPSSDTPTPVPSAVATATVAAKPKEMDKATPAPRIAEGSDAGKIITEDPAGCRILLVSYYCPTRAHAGGLRILDLYGLIKKQCPSARIDLLTHHRSAIDWSIDEVYQLFDNVYLSPGEELSPAVLNNLAGQNLYRYDLVDLQFHQSAYHLEGFRAMGAKVLFTPMESQAKALYLELCEQIRKSGRIQLRRLVSQFKLACEEIGFCRKADEVVCVSRTDAAFIRAVGGGRHVRGIETGLSPLEFASALTDEFLPLMARDRSNSVIYVAYFGSETNVNALRWYLETVHPIVVRAVPDYRLLVVGRGDLSSFGIYEGRNVELVGEVQALEPYIRTAGLGIAPALGGSGFRGKVNQYSILGIPSVTSSIALKGLAYRDQENISVADSSEVFAECCIRLLTDNAWNDRMATEARKLCLERYTWISKWPQIRATYRLNEGASC